MSAPIPLSAVEVALTYGGDYMVDATGDLVLVRDDPYTPNATIQRVVFLILTNPAIPRPNGQGASSPDDPFNPSYGAGCRAYVGYPNATQYVDAVQRSILSALLDDPFISPNPRPTVTIVEGSDSGQLLVNVTFTTITGQNITIPDIQLGG